MDRGNHPVAGKKINMQQENYAIVNNVGDEILLNKTQKVSTARQATEFLDSNYDENNLHQVEIMSVEETKENYNDVSVFLNENIKFHMGFKIKMV